MDSIVEMESHAPGQPEQGLERQTLPPEYQGPQQPVHENQLPQQQPVSFLRTCLNGINAVSGVGILSMPFALSQGGWLSFMILIIVASLCFYTGLLLKKCMDTNPQIKTYPDIGFFAFGNKGEKLISIFLYVELYLVAVDFLILEGDSLNKLFPHLFFHIGSHKVGGNKVFLLIATLVVLPTVWLKDLGCLAYFSVGGILASVTLLICVCWVALSDGIGFHQRGSLWDWKGLPTAISIYSFAYCGHTVFPTLYNSMGSKSTFHKVLMVCFVLSTIIYGSMAVLGYLMFGKDITSQITLNLPTEHIGSKLAVYTTIINPISKYAVIAAPIFTAIEHTTPFHDRRLRILLMRTMLVITTGAVALIIPHFGIVMAFIGSFSSISLSIIFPCLCYLRMHNLHQRFRMESVVLIVIAIIGSFIAVIGTYLSVKDIITHV